MDSAEVDVFTYSIVNQLMFQKYQDRHLESLRGYGT